MLNPAQAEYINKLREDEPGIEESVFREMFKDAGWPDFEIDEAISRYRGDFAAVSQPPIPSSTPSVVETIVDSTIVTEPKSFKKVIILVVALLSICALAGATYFLVGKYSKPAMVELTDETLLTHLYEKMSSIEKVSYDATFSLGIEEREEGALAFSDLTPVDPEVLAKYQRDYDRIRYVQKIKDTLEKIRPRFNSTPVTTLYPKTLEEVGLVSTDPLGEPYTYTRSSDGTAYTLEVTMETIEAYQAMNYSSYSYDSFDTETAAATTNTKKVTLNQDSYINSYSFDGKPAQPKLFGFFALDEIESIIPNNLFASFSFGGSIDNETDKPADARMHLAGEVSLGDANFAVDLEGIKKNDKYFGIVNKIPTIFSMFSQLRGKWVGLTENDLRNYGYGEIYDEFIPSGENERQQKMDEARATSNKLLQVATKHKVVSISAGPEVEMIGEEKLNKYSLKLNKDSLVPFVEEAVLVLKEVDDDINVNEVEELVAYLKSEDFDRSFAYLSDNVTFNIWFDEEGYPVKMEQKVRYVPSEEAPALKGKQIKLTFTLVLSGINQKLEVKEPEEYMTFDELMVELTGKTLEEVKIENQQKNITAIRNALREYVTWTGTYPTTLEDLLKKRKDVTKNTPTTTSLTFDRSYNSSYGYDNSYMDELPFIGQLPSDVYSNVAYEYTASGDDYKLTYTINLVPYTTEKDPSNYYFADYGYSWYEDENGYGSTRNEDKVLSPKFVDGLNIATKDVLSQASNDTKDQDGDKLADTLEVILGTDPKIADTDKDGFTDYEEITTGSNPNGPGKLDYKRSDGFFF
jgi:type II secretory pathway pseudopilin PulG